MPVDNAGAPTSGDPFQYVVIPLNKDVLPYAQLEAQDKYKSLSMPDDLPPTLGVLAASDKNFQGEMLSTDGKRNLNVHVVNAGGGPNGPGVVTWTLDAANQPSPLVIDAGGAIPAGASLLGIGAIIQDVSSQPVGTVSNIFTIGIGDYAGSGAFLRMADGCMSMVLTAGTNPLIMPGVPVNLQLGTPVPFAAMGMDSPINVVVEGSPSHTFHEITGWVRVWYV